MELIFSVCLIMGGIPITYLTHKIIKKNKDQISGTIWKNINIHIVGPLATYVISTIILLLILSPSKLGVKFKNYKREYSFKIKYSVQNESKGLTGKLYLNKNYENNFHFRGKYHDNKLNFEKKKWNSEGFIINDYYYYFPIEIPSINKKIFAFGQNRAEDILELKLFFLQDTEGDQNYYSGYIYLKREYPWIYLLIFISVPLILLYLLSKIDRITGSVISLNRIFGETVTAKISGGTVVYLVGSILLYVTFYGLPKLEKNIESINNIEGEYYFDLYHKKFGSNIQYNGKATIFSKRGVIKAKGRMTCLWLTENGRYNTYLETRPDLKKMKNHNNYNAEINWSSVVMNSFDDYSLILYKFDDLHYTNLGILFCYHFDSNEESKTWRFYDVTNQNTNVDYINSGFLKVFKNFPVNVEDKCFDMINKYNR